MHATHLLVPLPDELARRPRPLMLKLACAAKQLGAGAYGLGRQLYTTK